MSKHRSAGFTDSLGNGGAVTSFVEGGVLYGSRPSYMYVKDLFEVLSQACPTSLVHVLVRSSCCGLYRSTDVTYYMSLLLHSKEPSDFEDLQASFPMTPSPFSSRLG